MNAPNPPLPLGYSPVPPGHIANVVTCLEMLRRPETVAAGGFPPPYRLVPVSTPDITAYRALFRKIGERWMWFSRLIMPEAELAAILHDPKVEVYVLRDGDADVGLLELDFRQDRECELAFLGLAEDAIGKGLGGGLMAAAIATAWARPIERFWVHTCHFDHPAAVGFYIHAGFRPYAYQVEVQVDPRLTGHLPRHAAPHVPLIGPA